MGAVMAKIACIDDLRKLAERRVPRMFYDLPIADLDRATYRANE